MIYLLTIVFLASSAIAGPMRTVDSDPSKADVKKLQQSLKHLGFDPGPVDGVSGPRTRAAIRAFQKKHSLESTGKMDAATLKLLEQQVAGAPPSPPTGLRVVEVGVE
jgi:peptidoglycan hydrolase-like protein with peptidoglycan-binding domain